MLDHALKSDATARRPEVITETGRRRRFVGTTLLRLCAIGGHFSDPPGNPGRRRSQNNLRVTRVPLLSESAKPLTHHRLQRTGASRAFVKQGAHQIPRVACRLQKRRPRSHRQYNELISGVANETRPIDHDERPDEACKSQRRTKRHRGRLQTATGHDAVLHVGASRQLQRR